MTELWGAIILRLCEYRRLSYQDTECVEVIVETTNYDNNEI